MSSFAAPVVPYAAEEHPNADLLEMAVVGGWRAVCRIGDFSEGRPVAYIPEGALLPWELVEELGLADPPRLAGPGHNRVKAIRLRGLLSQGLVYGGDRIAHLSIGDDAVDALGLTKWIPQVPVHMAGPMMPGPKVNYDISDIKSWPGRMVAGEDSVVTEKMHGTFCCMGLLQEGEGETPTVVVSSKGQFSKGRRFDVDADENVENLYVRMWLRHAENIRELFTEWPDGPLAADGVRKGGDGSFSIYLFGEVCGPKVQDLQYGLPGPAFHLFDVRVNGAYLDWGGVEKVARKVGVPTVPVLERGPWAEVLLGRHTEGISTMASHHREGVVVRPAVTRYDNGLDHESGRGPGRMILKSVSEKHLLRKGGTEHN